LKRSIPSDLIEESGVTTDPRFGSYPDERPLSELLRTGLVIIDKPRGPSSHEVVAWTKQILHLEKAGHSGTLDPKVTGVLPVALDSGTKVVKQLLDMGKEYVCLMRLHKDVQPDSVRDVLSLFTGKIFQRPPVKSAVKRQVRVREIYSIDIIDIIDQFVLFRVACEAGTYIRKLVYDIGMVLGSGANMVELRRSRVASISEADAITLQQLSDAYHAWVECGDEAPMRSVVHPIEFAVSHLPKVWVKDSAIDAICHGANLAVPGLVRADHSVRKGEKVAMMSLKGELVAVAIAKIGSKKLQKMDTGFVADTIRVVMEPGTYPRTWKSSN
jgi:H/ACA ribonucleoprotein complex subunit 4